MGIQKISRTKNSWQLAIVMGRKTTNVKLRTNK